MEFDKRFYNNSFRRASLNFNSIQSIIKGKNFEQLLSELYWLTSFLNRKYLIAPGISKFTCLYTLFNYLVR